MPKHKRDENYGSKDQPKGSSPKKVANATAVCEYCRKVFTMRGMPLHQRKCSKKQAHDKAAAKKIRSYKFSILNEAIHEEILSFLSNQTLTKMQMITGDRYPNCEPELARYCCKCEDDNPVIEYSRCRQCASKRRCDFLFTTKEIAKDKYGVQEKYLDNIPFDRCYGYDPIKLENLMIQKCGSKMEWLRCLAKKHIRRMKARATRKKNLEDIDAHLKSLAPGFASYVWAVGLKETNKNMLEQCSHRFVALTAKLRERGLTLLAGSDICMNFITNGFDSIEDVVDAEVNGVSMVTEKGEL